MKYYRKTNAPAIDYAGDDFQPCWTCKKACGGCSWSRSFTPVKGWEAVPTHIPSNGEYADSYKIIKCPQYEAEKR